VLAYQHHLKILNHGRNTIVGSENAMEKGLNQSLMAPRKGIVMQEIG
jgi:hypothetical protein